MMEKKNPQDLQGVYLFKVDQIEFSGRLKFDKVMLT